MKYVVFDRVTESFLVRLNKRTPLKSKWGGSSGDSGVSGVQAFDTRKTGEYVAKQLSKAWQGQPGGVDFAVIKVKPITIYEYQEWSW